MRNRKAVEVKRHVTKHLPPVPVWFHEPAIDPADGWCEGKPGTTGRVIAVKSVLYSDGSAKRWYRMAAVKKLKQKKNSKKRVK